MTKLTRLTLEEWQQFRSVDLEFHPRLTVLTGANASGKTTILSLLARHADWQVPALSVPTRSAVTGVIQFLTRFFGGRDRSTENVIGAITYSNGQSATDSPPIWVSLRPQNQIIRSAFKGSNPYLACSSLHIDLCTATSVSPKFRQVGSTENRPSIVFRTTPRAATWVAAIALRVFT